MIKYHQNIKRNVSNSIQRSLKFYMCTIQVEIYITNANYTIQTLIKQLKYTNGNLFNMEIIKYK